MIKARRKNFQLGGSKAITLPGGMQIGEESTMAGDRLLILDPLGEIPEDALGEFLIEHIEPSFWSWWQARKERQFGRKAGDVVAMQEGTLPRVSIVKPLKAQGVARLIPDAPLVTCFRCGQLIAWVVDPRAVAVCPRCRAFLRLLVRDSGTVGQVFTEAAT